ncbi:MAG TPA: hypothetical protein VFY88_13745 [Intrasporangium sp.]|nr:hypothetical protein [Intrasporangium sp.]
MNGDTRARGSRVHLPRVSTTRRLFLVGGGAALLAAVTGCGLRVDLPQPPPPVPTRRRAPDEALVIGVVRDLDALLRAWPRAARPAVLKESRTLLTELRTVLVGRLTNEGVPAEEITPAAADPSAGPAPAPTSTTGAGSTTGSTTGPTTSAPTSGPLSVGELRKRLAALPSAHLAATTSATAGTRELLTAAYGTIFTSAGLLGADVAPAAEAGPVRPQLAERTSPLVYAFEVVAAQSSGTQRRRALDTLERLRGLERLIGRDDAASGWSLPFPVNDQGSARRLGDTVLKRAVGAPTEVPGTAPTTESLDDIARWVAAVQLAADTWGLDPVTFPGMEQPDR